MNSEKKKNFFVNLSISLITLLVTFVVLELILIFSPVTTSANWMPITSETPLLRHTPNHSITYSIGWNFAHSNERWSNNFGFLNDQEYVAADEQPLIAVIGDSYVEALINSYELTFYGRMAASLKGRARIYSFGVSGAQLSQYIAWAKFVEHEFQPDALIVSIIANDFDESFYRYKRTRGFHYFDDTKPGTPLVLVERIDSTLRKMMLRSSLGRYVFYHIHAGDVLRNSKYVLEKIIEGDNTPGRYIGNVVASVPKVQEEDGRKATDLFLERIANAVGLKPSRILFVIDGIRPSLYDEGSLLAARGSYWAKMRVHFISKANKMGFEVIDMQWSFSQHYRENQQKFEYAMDGHWNDLAHQLVANELLASKLINGVATSNQVLSN